MLLPFAAVLSGCGHRHALTCLLVWCVPWQGFELYGVLRMGQPEDEIESIVNPSELTEGEEGLLDIHNQVQTRKKLSWDPKVLMERERQREYNGPTYADKMSEAYREVEERFERLTTQAILAGRERDGKGAAEEVVHAGTQDRSTHDSSGRDEGEAAAAAASSLVSEQPRIELVNLKMMDADELLHFVWGQEKTCNAMFDVKRWVQLPENARKHAQVVGQWLHLASARGARESSMTCEILEDLAQEGLLDSKVVGAAVASEKLQDVLRAENMMLQERLNLVLKRLGLAAIPCSAGGEDHHHESMAGGDEADDEDELALIAELAAMRAADGGGGDGNGSSGEGRAAGLAEEADGGEEEADRKDDSQPSSTEPSLSESDSAAVR